MFTFLVFPCARMFLTSPLLYRHGAGVFGRGRAASDVFVGTVFPFIRFVLGVQIVLAWPLGVGRFVMQGSRVASGRRGRPLHPLARIVSVWFLYVCT